MRELIGLRDEDLTVEEQAALAALLGSDDAAADEHAAAFDLGAELAALPGTGGPSAQAVLDARQPRRRQWWIPTASAMALAATLALALGLPLAQRNKGLGTATAVHVEAAAEGEGLRPLAADAVVGPEERVLFRITTDGPGELTLVAGGEILMGAVPVEAGEHVLGGDQPLSWRPDAAGAGAVEAWLCPAGAAPGDPVCSVDRLRLRWAE